MPLMVIDAVAYWSFTSEPNKMSGKYQVDLGQLDDATVQKLSVMGVSVKNKADKDGKNTRGNFVTGKSKFPIMVVDADKKEMDPSIKIGNGSVVRAVVQPYAYSQMGKSGVALGLQTLQVTKLVELSTVNSLSILD